MAKPSNSIMFPLLALLISVLAASQAPLFDICSWKDARPELYYDYLEPECMSKWHLMDDGDCNCVLYDPECFGFCQIKTTFFYGQEQPMDNYPECRGPNTCTIGELNRVT
jgi:hypothetical protein